MAGHSKWANIQHRKGAQDAKRGKLFTRLIREVTVSAKLGGPDPISNSRLRLAMDKAFAGNVPKDTVERAIKRAAGDADAQNIEEIRYEGYGPSGTAIIADCMTDNRNRTVAAVRHAFSKCGGSLGTNGSVAYLFSQVGQLTVGADVDEEELMDLALSTGADDVITNDDGTYDILTSVASFSEVKTALDMANIATTQAQITLQCSTQVVLALEEAKKMLQLVDMLEELDDVQHVYSNADISEETLQALNS